MDEKLLEAQDILLEKVNKICRDFGLNNVMAQLYVILYFSHKSMSLDDMSKRLKISKGSVSVNIRSLERYGAVHRVWIKGTRKDYYEAETNISKVVMERFKSMAERRMSVIKTVIDTSSTLVSSAFSTGMDDKEAVKVFKERLGNLKEIQNKIQLLLDFVNSGVLHNMLNSKTEQAKSKEVIYG